MEEGLRRRYLQELGIQPLRLRRPLPGALARELPEPAVPVEPGPQPEVPSPPARAARPAIEIPGDSPARKSPAPAPKSGGLAKKDRGRAVRFSLCIALCDRGLMIVDDGRADGAHAELLQNLARALCAGPVKMSCEQFNWPLGRGLAGGQGREAAMAELRGVLCAQAERHALKAVLLGGETAAGLLFPEPPPRGECLQLDGMAVPLLRTASAAEMLADPLQKRTVWREVQLLMPLLAE